MNKTSRSITLWPFPTLTFLFKQMTAACLPHNNFREWLVVNVVHNCTSNFLSSVASNLCITCNYTNSTYFVVCRQWLQMDCVEQTTLALSWGRHSLMMLELFLYLHDQHDWQCHNSPPSPCHNWQGSWWLHGCLQIYACCDLMLTSSLRPTSTTCQPTTIFTCWVARSVESPAQYRSDPWTLWLLDWNLSYVYACFSRSIDFTGL